jgi:tungstate transport system substrate-binding protein
MKLYCRRFMLLGIIALLLVTLGSAVQAQERTLILATTTSTQDTGLLDVLIPIFEKKTGYFVKTIAVGSGQAMTMGQRGEADVLLVHSPAAEKKFMDDGFGVSRRLVMHNDYIIAGPADDPAKIKGLKSAAEAFKKIAAAQALFVSRGDNSGTHAKEKDIWKVAGSKYEGEKWYQQTGLGMGQTLNVSAEKKGYTLADRGTYLAMAKTLKLDILQRLLRTSWSPRKLRRSSRPTASINTALLSSSLMRARRWRIWGSRWI